MLKHQKEFRNTQLVVAATTNKSKNILHVVKPVSTLIERIPTTRYYGSKRRLLKWLYSKLKGLEFETVLDPFGGTACVSQMFRAMGKKVTYHDAFHFNIDVATTLLAGDVALSKSDLDEKIANVEPTESLISRNFKGIFYTAEENVWLDGFMAEIGRLDRSDSQTKLLLYLLYQACLKKRPFNLFHRANLDLRTNQNIERSFGNSVTWESPFSDHMNKAFDELVSSRINTAPIATILSPHSATNIESGYDLVYLDPPYAQIQGQNSSDDYWRKYHFLEGLALYDTWENEIDAASPIRMMKAPNQFVEWSDRANLRDALFDLIKIHNSSIVVLSYVANAYPNELEIKKYFESLFSDVSLHSIEHSYALSKSKKRELLFIGLPT